MKKTIAVFILALFWSISAHGFELDTVKIDDNIYALTGALGLRSYDNHALNSTMGLVIVDDGVVLIDSGASYQGAALIETAIAKITDKPVRYVINTGTQDHRWLGNGYFAERGARIIALTRTVKAQKEFADNHLIRLAPILKDRLEGTRPVYASKPLPGDNAVIILGGRKFEFIWPGHAHFADDAIIWLADARTAFVGDLVFMQRLLGVLPMSNAPLWAKAFAKMAALKPLHIIPGHGHPGTLADASADTGDYLKWLIAHVKPEVKNWTPLKQTVEKLAQAPFTRLKNFKDLHKMNVNRTYLNIETAQ